jgi:hypothetical protein
MPRLDRQREWICEVRVDGWPERPASPSSLLGTHAASIDIEFHAQMDPNFQDLSASMRINLSPKRARELLEQLAKAIAVAEGAAEGGEVRS